MRLVCWFESLAVASRPLQRRRRRNNLLLRNRSAEHAEDRTTLVPIRGNGRKRRSSAALRKGAWLPRSFYAPKALRAKSRSSVWYVVETRSLPLRSLLPVAAYPLCRLSRSLHSLLSRLVSIRVNSWLVFKNFPWTPQQGSSKSNLSVHTCAARTGS